MTTMKKTIRLTGIITLILLVACLFLGGCGSGAKSTESPESVADALMKALQDGELDKVASLTTEEALNEDLAYIAEIQSFADGLVESLGASTDQLPDEAKKAVEDLQKVMIEDYVKSYEISNVTDNGDTATVECEVAYGFDPESIEESDYADEVKTLMQTYIVDNYEELTKIMTEEGEEALTQRLINDTLPMICENLTKALKENQGKNEKVIIGTEKIDGKWIVSEARIAE